MSKWLATLGLFSFKKPWLVIISWVVILGLLGGLATLNFKPTSDSISIPNTPAQKAIDRMKELFPNVGSASGRIVFKAAEGTQISDYRSTIDKLLSEVKAIPNVTGIVSPFDYDKAISTDKTVAYAQVQLNGESGSIDTKTLADIQSRIESARLQNLEIESGGDLINKAPGEILGVGEVAGVVLALIVLVITLGSLIAAGMPILIAVVTVGVSMAGLFALSHVIDISSTTPVLAVMLGLAVGIDYSLFIISKYRNYLLEGNTFEDAVRLALSTAGNAVVFAAGTVVIALAALTIVQIPFMTTMGLAGAATIALAAAVAVSLIPAFLGLVKARIFNKKLRAKVVKAQDRGPAKSHPLSHKTIWYKWGSFIVKHPIIMTVASLVILGALAYPVAQLKLGLPTDEFAAQSSTQRKAYDIMSQKFGDGFNGPLIVVVDNLPAVSDADRAAVRDPLLKNLNQQIADQQKQSQQKYQTEMANASTPEQIAAIQQQIQDAQREGETKKQAALAQIDQAVTQYAKYIQLQNVATKIAERRDVAFAQPALVTDNGTSGVIQVVSRFAPSSENTEELISALRDPSKKETVFGSTDLSIGVTGSAALQSDINHKLADALPVYLSVVVGLSLLLLVIAFRSILVPIKATIGFLLSVLAMFGSMVAVFQLGWFGIAEAPGPIVSFIPIIATGILFGLAMDYEFFLVSSMHEKYHQTKQAKQSVIDGFALGAKVVTAAGVIMVSVFAGFITNHDATIQAIGFGLAIGILVDAFIVRMTLVPALMSLMGSSAWWLPRWLDRILPHVSIEGEDIGVQSKRRRR